MISGIIEVHLIAIVSQRVLEVGEVVLEEQVVLTDQQHGLAIRTSVFIALPECLNVRSEGMLGLPVAVKYAMQLLFCKLLGDEMALNQRSLLLVHSEFAAARALDSLNEL